jgi:dihydrofolate reductase
MRNLFWQVSVTLDGFMEGPNGELESTAQFADEDFDHYAGQMLRSIGGILLGRKTYQLFADYWPSASGPDADRMNQLPKVVFSRTLEQVGWQNTRLVRENVAEEVTRLKQEVGGDLALFGSADLATTLLHHGLIDEFRILVTPVLLGRGKPWFQGLGDQTALKLSSATTWSSGTVALSYLLQPGRSRVSPGSDSQLMLAQ